MKKLIYVLFILPMFAGCYQGSMTEKLNGIDSLIVKEQYDSASVILKNMANASMTDEDQAHYGLLATKLGYFTYQPLESDSLLDLAVSYYKKAGNQEKLADAIYYKARRSALNGNYPQGIIFCKEAESLADNSSDISLQFKIAEYLAYLNGLCENHHIQLQYAKKSLPLALKAKKGNWIVYSYNNISFAFHRIGQQDSALFYIEKTIPYIDYVLPDDKAIFLMNIGVLYKDDNQEKAKEYFEKALSFNELPEILEHLADIYYAEGKEEEAYKLWKKALTKESRYEKDDLIRSILVYDIEHKKLEDASKYIDEIFAIKDSIITSLRNDTIKDLQLRFDHEIAMHQQEQAANKWKTIGLIVLLLMMVMIVFILRKRYDDKMKLREAQMQIKDYTIQIHELEASQKDASETIEELKKKIKEKLEELSPEMIRGQMLFEQIKKGEINSIHEWSRDDEKLFVDYYNVMDYVTVNRLTSVKRAGKLTTHNLFYLLLKEMGKTDSEIQELFGISHNALKVIKSKTKEID